MRGKAGNLSHCTNLLSIVCLVYYVAMENIKIDHIKFKFPEIVLSEEAADRAILTPTTKPNDEGLSTAIGNFLYHFSSLEWGVEEEIGQLYDISSQEAGRSVIKYLTAADKFKLLYELQMARLDRANPNHKVQLKKQFMNLQRMMVEAAELRNIIAHANWTEKTTDGFVKTTYKQSKDTGRYTFILYQLNTENINKLIAHIEYIVDSQCHAWDYVLD